VRLQSLVGASGRALSFPVGRLGMRVSRRKFTAVAASAVALTASVPLVGEPKMYGRIGRMTTAPGKRDELIAILLGGTSSMPGCLSYIVAQDPTNSDAIWITEVWDSQSSHKASLSLPSVKDAISRGKVLITGFDKPIETVPVGGYGLHAAT
jgi:quinol monooxygenase YgiN